MVQPDLTTHSARNIGAKIYKKSDVKYLHAHLMSLLCRAQGPLTADCILTKLEQLFRNTESPKEAMALGEKIIQYRGLDMTGCESMHGALFEEDSRFLEEFIAGHEDL